MIDGHLKIQWENSPLSAQEVAAMLIQLHMIHTLKTAHILELEILL